jgi:two-component system sensor histidine kinase BaeS
LLLKIRRVPIALRLFLTVLLTTLVITTVSLGVLHWTMQKNFAKYVADVEMQKLDHLIDNLAGVYSTYHDWGNAIQAQILQIEGHAAPDDYDRLVGGCVASTTLLCNSVILKKIPKPYSVMSLPLKSNMKNRF